MSGDPIWISPVDSARVGNTDPLSRMRDLETAITQLRLIDTQTQDLSEASDDLGVVTTGSLYFGTGDPQDLTTLPTGLFVDQVGVHIFNAGVEVGRFGNLLGFLMYAAVAFGIGIGDATNGYLLYDPVNGLRIKGTSIVTGINPLGFDVFDEPVLGLIDGVNAFFCTANLASSQLMVSSNGIWYGPIDISGGGGSEVIFFKALDPADIVLVNYIRSDTKAAIYNEIPTSFGDNHVFITAFGFDAPQIQVYVNGVLMSLGVDYVGGNSQFGLPNGAPPNLNIPQPGDILRATYMVTADPKLVVMEGPTGLINGVNKVFTLGNNYISGTVMVVLNGVRQTITNDYTESAANQITFVNAPITNDYLWTTYRKP